MKIKPSEIKKFINGIPKNNIAMILLYGPDVGLSKIRSNEIVKSYLGESYQLEQKIILYDNILKENPSKLQESALSMSLFGDSKKAIIIKDATDTLNKLLKEYIDNPDDVTLVVIEAGDLPSTSSLRKLCDSNSLCASIPAYVDTIETLNEYIANFFNEHKYKVDQDALIWLCNNLGNDRGISEQELQKLLLYKHQDKHITINAVETIIVDNSASSIDKLVYHVFNKNIVEAYKYLAVLLDEYHSVVLIRSLLNHCIRLLQVKALVEAGGDVKTSMLVLRPPVFFSLERDFIMQINQYSLDELKDILNQILNIEINSKTIAYLGELQLKQLIININKT
jgi:DNA polymerase-3 subunit delta